MCSDQQHQEQMHLLERIAKAVESTDKKPPEDTTYMISTTQPLVIDYKERRHLFIWSANALTLSLEDIGTLSVSANTWTNIGYQQGMRLVPSSQASTIPVFVRATDETVP